ncbi:hypothetical protein [Spongiimicrobium sp. 3-5]|uniref:hypothetical protein n=1 Tax=Spongiimicrobium sp. 3-5 TaxID=3332596 RepID=UPI00397F793C
MKSYLYLYSNQKGDTGCSLYAKTGPTGPQDAYAKPRHKKHESFLSFNTQFGEKHKSC